jgi:hypothetical protein
VPIARVVGSIFLGVLTYDASCLVIEPRARRRARGDDDRGVSDIGRLGPAGAQASRSCSARTTSPSPRWSELEGVRVFNLCRRYRLPERGLLLSLLAMAGATPAMPNLTTLLEMRSRTMVRAGDDELEESIQRTLRTIPVRRVRALDLLRRDPREALRALSAAPLQPVPRCPLLRAHFKPRAGPWRSSDRADPRARDPRAHLPSYVQAAERYFARPRLSRAPPPTRRVFHLAILTEPKEASRRRTRARCGASSGAAEKVGFGVE